MIRYNGLVLKPTGSFQTDTGSEGLIWWYYLVLSAGIVALVLAAGIVLLSLVIVSKKKKTSPYQRPLVTVNLLYHPQLSTLHLQDNDYDVSFKKDQGEVSFEKPIA